MPDEKRETGFFATQEGRSLPVLFADSLIVNKRNDGFHLLQIMVSLPEGPHEQARVMITEGQLRRFIESLCVHCDYYPERSQSVPSAERPAATST